jgi:hypothetical protein
MKLVNLPVELCRELLQYWLWVDSWTRLDTAYCSKLDRHIFLGVLADLPYESRQFPSNSRARADLEFVWCATRKVKLHSLDVYIISAQPVDILKYKHSLTALSLTRLVQYIWDRRDWVLRILAICPNIEHLAVQNFPHDQIDDLNNWCPNLTHLSLNYYNRCGLYSFDFCAYTALKRLFISTAAIRSLTLPSQLEEFSFDGSVDEPTFLSAFLPCTKLTKVRVMDDTWTESFPSARLFHILPQSVVALRFKGCSELSFVLQKFTTLTELTVKGCQYITQEQFDNIFMLPRITYLSLEDFPSLDVPEIERLSDGITCPTLKYLLMESFENINEDAMVSIVQRCPSLTYVRIDYMCQSKFPDLNDEEGCLGFRYPK